MNLLSLYSGVGGIDLAAHWARIRSVAFCESDPFCRRVLSRHWPEVPIFESDEEVSASALLERGVDRVDIIAGGPPCQPFSIAGKRGGTADPRHRWPEMARIVADVLPRWVVVENVGGFVDVAKPLVLPDLEGMGYDAWAIEIPAAAVGAPHCRPRIFIVAYGCGSGRDGAVGNSASSGREGIRAGGVEGMDEADGTQAGRNEERRVPGCSGVGTLANSSEQRRTGSGATRDGWGGLFDPSTLESRLGRVASRLSDRMDSALWPAARRCQQYAYEPSRVTTEREHRRKRVKALGNACVPLQVYPILALIAELGCAEVAA